MPKIIFEKYIEEELIAFVNSDPRNSLTAHNHMRIYDTPLFGIASALDPYFSDCLKSEIIGPSFLLPKDWLPCANSVISYFLPFTQEIRESNLLPGLPSEEWVSARIDGEHFNNVVRSFLVDLLSKMDEDAIAPPLDPRFQVNGFVSNWSERHVAYAAGLGTFGLHKALITKRGATGRFGSVVSTIKLTPTPRPYTSYDEYCPYLTQGTCGACIKRCPPDAITKAGKDHKVCHTYINDVILSKYAPRYGCAKCNVGVPCAFGIPEKGDS